MHPASRNAVACGNSESNRATTDRATRLVAPRNLGRLDFLTQRENCPEVCVGRYHDALLPSGTIENILIVGSLQSVLTYVDCVVTSIPEKRRHQR